MPTRTVRHQPYRGGESEYTPLLDFVRSHIALLQPGFEPATEQSGDWSNEEPYDWEERGWQYGTEQGIKVTFFEQVEPKWLSVMVRVMTVSTFGLMNSRRLALKSERYMHNPRYIELTVEGPRAAIEQIAAAFELEFGGEQAPTAEQLAEDLTSAEISVRARAWGAAEVRARGILKHKPDNARALFYLGVALAATNRNEEAREYLARAVKADPKNYDAWYNLGNVSFEQGRYEEAIKHFRRSLKVSPDNHPVFYQLGMALEKMGKIEEAIAAYRDAVRTAPNPGQVWGYSGLDFEVQAKKALRRLERSK